MNITQNRMCCFLNNVHQWTTSDEILIFRRHENSANPLSLLRYQNECILSITVMKKSNQD